MPDFFNNKHRDESGSNSELQVAAQDDAFPKWCVDSSVSLLHVKDHFSVFALVVPAMRMQIYSCNLTQREHNSHS